MSRVCNKCLIEKPLEEYHRGKSSKDGRVRVCKACTKVADNIRYQKDKERISKVNKEWAANNKQRKRQINLKSKRKNSAKSYEYLKSWREANQDRVRWHNSKYRAAKQNATPFWLTEEQSQQIYDTYVLAKECEVLTGDKYHVDHIIPLNGEHVCGLHVPWNLQVLPADINIRKSNKAAFQ
jgi:hypothetical protein